MDQDDHELVQAIAHGDADALNVLYERYGLELLNYLIHQLDDRKLAEEVLQNVMLGVWQGASRFEGASSVRTWLFAIARRQMLNQRRRRKLPTVDVPADDLASGATTDPVQVIESAENRAELGAALHDLPLDQQEALELFFYRDLSLAEAAARVGVNVNTFKSRLHRAKANLRKWFAERETDNA